MTADGSGRTTGGSFSRRHLAEFAGNDDFLTAHYELKQPLDFQQLRGRFFSSSYTPKTGTPEHEEFSKKLQRIFNQHNRDGVIEFQYRTEVTLAKMSD